MTNVRLAATLSLFGALVLAVFAINAGSYLPAAATDSYSMFSPQVKSTGNSSLPIFWAINNGTGPGVRGDSVNGSGVFGLTTAGSPSLDKGHAGLIGQDLSSTSSFNAGVRGFSRRGIGLYGIADVGPGVRGETFFRSTSSANGRSGVFGIDSSTSGTFNSGTAGASTSGTGVFGLSTNGFGVRGVSSNSDGVASVSTNANGVRASSVNGNGVTAFSQNNTALYVTDGYPNNNASLFVLAGNNSANSGEALKVAVPVSVGTPFPILRLDDGGNLAVHGTVTGGHFVSRLIARDHVIAAYAGLSTHPTIEDFGEALLLRGAAYIGLAPDFSQAIGIDRYLVFITPEGDNRGLYVASQSLGGFEVRESEGGRSTLAFYWRIVARPVGSIGTRLPAPRD
jgi:hypothetical protein